MGLKTLFKRFGGLTQRFSADDDVVKRHQEERLEVEARLRAIEVQIDNQQRRGYS